MKTTFGTLRVSVAALSCALLLPLLPGTAGASPVQASRADDFVNSIGVDLHVDYYPDSTSWNTVAAQLGALGIRSVRDGLQQMDNPTTAARLQGLYNSYGMKLVAGCSPQGNDDMKPGWNGSTGLQHIADLVAANQSMILAVEGPNEPEYFWTDSWNYGGFSDRPSQVVWYQNLLYNTIKGDSRTSSMPVTSFALASPSTIDNWGWGTSHPAIKEDITSWHYYNGSQTPTPYDWYSKVRNGYSAPSTMPSYLTEHGYCVSGATYGPVTRLGQMKLDTRSMLFFFSQGDFPANQKTYFYVGGRDFSNGQDYGLDNADYSPRPVYNSMKSVLNYLKEATWNTTSKTWSGPTFSPGSLDYTISGDTSSYGFRLLQKSTGEFYLMTLPYLQVAVNGSSTGADITNSPHNVTISFPSNMKVSSYKVDETSGNYSETLVTGGSKAFNAYLGDTLQIFKISPSSLNTTVPLGQNIVWKSNFTGKYVTANIGGSNTPLLAGWATSPGDWERFQVVDAGGGLVALKSLKNNLFVSCNVSQGAGSALQAGWATSIGTWEKFQWVDLGGGNFNLKANINGYFTSSDQNLPNKDLRAAFTTNSASTWESFSWLPSTG